MKTRSVISILQDAKYKRPLVSHSKPYIPSPIPVGGNLLTENNLPILTENNLNITI